MPSEGVNNAGIFQGAEIDIRDENQWLGAWFRDGVLEITVHLDPYFFSTVGAFCSNGQGQLTFEQLPLHEGRRNRVDTSSGVYFLP